MDLVTGAVTGAVGSIISKLGELLKDECKLQMGVKDKVKHLTRELESAHAALRKVAGVPQDQVDELIRIWARDVREASYNMEDILDTFLVHMEGGGKHAEQESLLKGLAEKVSNIFKNIKERRKISGAIEEIKKRLEEVTDRHARYTVDSIGAKPTSSRTVDPRLAAMYREASQLIGIDKSRGDLMSMLSLPQGDEDESNKKMKIVSVVGVGGLGKTTLAKAVYDELKTMFDCGAFIPVGRNPDSKKILRQMLIDLGYNDFSKIKILEDEWQLINEFRSFLGTKRYFIVIDDVWEIESWETIKLALVENNTRSRIITTTRNLEVCTGDEVYKLQPLSYGSSKKLFYTRIYGGEEKCPNNQSSEVHEASEKILNKCGGVPLAIITMASLLVDKSMEDWIEVCNTIGFHDKDKKQVDDTMWILSLSYYDLPPHLKTCLLYLSAFPEDYVIRKDSLIWKWIAEGFVQKKSGLGLFEVGEGYFNDLINRSMIQAVESGVDFFTYGCQVHDMVLDLIRSFSREENFVTVLGNDKDTLSGSNARRLALQGRTTLHTLRMDVQQAVRSLIACSCRFNEGLSVQFEHLRVLHLEHIRYTDGNFHLDYLGSLFHLRYLGLRDVCIDKLPEEIGALKFLQVINLDCTIIRKLPSSVGLLKRLVCLCAWDANVPAGTIHKLTSLEELWIQAGEDNNSVRQFVKDVGNLGELRALRVVFPLMMDDSMQLELLKSLGNLRHMQDLVLGGHTYVDKAKTWNSVVLRRCLRRLSLMYVELRELPPCIHPSRLPILFYLELRVIDIDEQGLRALGGFPELCYLCLSTKSTATLTSSAADGCFPKLRSCVLRDSMVQLVPQEDSSVSFTIWNGEDTMAFGCKREDDCRVAPGIMLNVQHLQFGVKMWALTRNNGSCDNLGLEYLPSLQTVHVFFDCRNSFADDVEKEEAALRHTIDVHPNRPVLYTHLSNENEVKSRSAHDGVAAIEEDAEEDVVSSALHDDAIVSRRSEGEREATTS